jgi:hypothetical protein
LEALQSFSFYHINIYEKQRSLRAIITAFSNKHNGCEATIKILRGRLRLGCSVGFLGGSVGVLTVKSILAGDDNQPLDELLCGEEGFITLTDRLNLDVFFSV